MTPLLEKSQMPCGRYSGSTARRLPYKISMDVALVKRCHSSHVVVTRETSASVTPSSVTSGDDVSPVSTDCLRVFL